MLDDTDLRGARRLGFFFQFHFLLPEFTALENVLLPIRRLGALDAADTRSGTLLRSTGLEGKEFNTPPDRLSAGERQRLAIARVLATAPDNRIAMLDGRIASIEGA